APAQKRSWLYPGQSFDWPLTTTIERALYHWGIDLKKATYIEFQSIREFRRRVRDHVWIVQIDEVAHALGVIFCCSALRHLDLAPGSMHNPPVGISGRPVLGKTLSGMTCFAKFARCGGLGPSR